MKMAQPEYNEKPIINEKIYSSPNYEIYFSWYPAWSDELHYHFNITKATSTVIREINILADTLMKELGVDKVYTLIEAGDKVQETMCRLLHAEPFEEYEWDGQTYVKYYRRNQWQQQ